MKILRNFAEIALVSALTTACGVTNDLQNPEQNRTHMQEMAETNKGRVTREVRALQEEVVNQTFFTAECNVANNALICEGPQKEDISDMLDLVPYDLSVGFFVAPNIFDRESKIAYVSQPGGITTNSEFQETLWENRIPSQTESTKNGISYIRIGHEDRDLAVYAPAIALIASNDQCLIGRNNGNLLTVKCK